MSRGSCFWHAGAIANRAELERAVEARAGLADADLLWRLYERFGAEQASARIAGHVSWLIWDEAQAHLIAIGDRLGLHPLFYRRDKHGWLLSDRVAALLEDKPTTPLNHRALLMYVNMLGPLPGETYYDGVSQVVPRHVVTLTETGASSTPYWQVDAVKPLRLSSDDAYAEALRNLLFKVVGEYLPDGPVAFTLSGGLDSTSVAAAARASAADRKMASITWSMPELPTSDETPYSNLVADSLGLQRIDFRADQHWPLCHPDGVRTNRDSPWQSLYAETFTAMCARLAEAGFPTLLSGLDGDRLFATLTSYPDLLVRGRWGRLVRELRQQLIGSTAPLAQLKTALKVLLRDTIKAYRPHWRRGRPVPWAQPTSLEDLRAAVKTLEFPERGLPGRRARIRLTRDLWVGPIMSTLTRLTAEQGIDFRHPLLDHRLFEFAVGLPTTQVYRAGEMKVVVRNAMREHLPKPVLDLPTKAFTPMALAHRGLRERESEKIWPLLEGMRSAELGLIDETRIKTHYRAYLQGGPYDGSLWYALTAEDWLRRYF